MVLSLWFCIFYTLPMIRRVGLGLFRLGCVALRSLSQEGFEWL